MQKNRISLVMIAKNEARCIERCLVSIKPFVSDMIVLDTGSTDNTIEIAASCGAIIYTTKWMNDFSAARNTALELSNADYNFIVDADEWLIDGGESLNSEILSPSHYGLVLIKSDFDVSGENRTGNSWIPRLLPKGVRYEGRVHEQPNSKLQCVRLPIVLAHDGYTPEIRKNKIGRNKEILVNELRSNPKNPYLLYSIGKEYEVEGKTADAYKAYLNAKNHLEKFAPYSFDLNYRLIDTMLTLGLLDEAIIHGDLLIEKWSHIPDSFFILGYVFLNSATRDSERAIESWLPLAEQSWLRCLELGEHPEIDGTIEGRGSFLAAHNLVMLYEQLGHHSKANQYRHLILTSADSMRRHP